MAKRLILRGGGGVAASLPPLARTEASAALRPDFQIEIIGDPHDLRARLKATLDGGAATLFQRPGWLSSWYATVGAAQGAEPLLVLVSDRNTGRDVMALPLIRNRAGALQTIEFADLGVTDYNAPILGPAAPTSPKAAHALWKRIVKALPEADLIHFRKMPASVQGRPNPLVLLRSVHPCPSPGFSVSVPGEWEAYLRSLSKKFRKELGRSLRLFEEAGNAQFSQIDDVEEARRVLEIMNDQQRRRLKEMGYEHVLDEGDYQAFYSKLVTDGLKEGTTVLTVLRAGDALVAALLGVTDGASFAMVRLSHAGGDWMRIGPGRLVIERTMQMLHARGCRHFDFTIGDYPYKSGFGVEPSPLFDLVSAQSWRGQRSAARDLVKAKVKRTLDAIGISLVPKTVRERYRQYHSSSSAPEAASEP
jgi:CelD/BcsL family acetyltransferase involved in cellulose biosynthesis